MRRLLTLVVALAATASPAAAQDVATVTAETPISAYGGWIVWSASDDGSSWYMNVAHDGVTRRLAVDPQPYAFDADLGTAADGSTVATYSRCASTGGRCRIRVLDLETGIETSAGVPTSSRMSDTHPSMWRGKIAYARLQRGRRIDAVRLWDPKTKRTRELHGGTRPKDCTKCPAEERAYGRVSGLDLGARFAALRWEMYGANVVGHAGFEIRADRLADNKSILTGSGFAGEVCTGGIDGVFPSAPFVDSKGVWFAQYTTDCYHFKTSVERALGKRALARSTGAVDPIVVALTGSGTELIAMTATVSGEESPTCSAVEPCHIERLASPTFKPSTGRVSPPTF